MKGSYQVKCDVCQPYNNTLTGRNQCCIECELFARCQRNGNTCTKVNVCDYVKQVSDPYSNL